MKLFSFILSATAALALVGVSNVDFNANSTAAFAQDDAEIEFDSNEVDDSVYETLSTLLDVDEGESAEYYRERWTAIQTAASELPDNPKTSAFFEQNESKLREAFQTIYKYLADDEKMSQDEREMFFESFANGLANEGKVDELNALLEKYSAEKDGNPERARIVRSTIWSAKIQALAADDAEGIERLGDEFQAAALADEEFVQNTISKELADRLMEKNREAGGRVIAKLCAAFTASDSETLKKLGKELEAAARFANLVGNEMKVEGLFLDGTPIDWESYRGKVVLIDFWATWCGPCVGEIPNVQKMYEKYSAAGFDVIGYSLDENLDALKKFEEKKKLPWKTASQKMSTESAKKYVNLAEYYAIYGIPTMILVGKDGKVLDTDARGERLQELLKEQFPDVE